MIVLLIVLRILHVLGGVFWVGAALAMNLFINPSLRATAEAGQKVTAHLITQTKFAAALIVSSATTIIAGTWLYWIDSNGFSYGWMNTATGIVFGVGGLFAFVGWGTGFVLSNTGAAMGKLAGQIRGAPTPDQQAQLAVLGRRQVNFSTINLASLTIATVLMAMARFL
ncbi:MAG: hypothetical protein HYZ24_17025 [Chloroflexi bacterium]|nr:hypothetical protein [Chloroflexota bacterium]